MRDMWEPRKNQTRTSTAVTIIAGTGKSFLATKNKFSVTKTDKLVNQGKVFAASKNS